MEHEQVLPLQIMMNLGVMAIKEYSTLSRSSELVPHQRMLFSVITWTPFGGILSFSRKRTVNVF